MQPPPPLPGLEVSGLVRSQGDVVSGARVLFGSHPTYPGAGGVGPLSAETASGPGGTFRFLRVDQELDTPYNISIRDDSLGFPSLTHFVGVRSKKPNPPPQVPISHFWYDVAGERSPAAWSCPVVATVANAPAGAKAFFLATGGVVAWNGVNGVGSLRTVSWRGAYQANIMVRAVLYEEDPVTKMPLRYHGIATGPLTVVHGRQANWTATMQPITTFETEITLTSQGGVQGAVDGRVRMSLGPGSNSFDVARVTGSGKVILPHIPRRPETTDPEGEFELRAEQRTEEGTSSIYRGFREEHKNVGGEFPALPRFISPDPSARAALSRDTVFRWEGKGITRLRLDAGSAGRIDVITAGSEVQLPGSVLDALDFAIPAGTPIKATLFVNPHAKEMEDVIARDLSIQDIGEIPSRGFVLE